MAVSTAKEFSGPELDLDEFYEAKILSGDEVDSNYGGTRVNLVLQLIDDERQPLTDDEDKPLQIFNYVTVGTNSGKKSKLYQIWSGMFYSGKEVPEGEVMDTDLLVGKYCRFYWGMLPPTKDTPARPGVVRMAAPKSNKPAGTAAPNRAKALEDDIDNA